MEKKLPFVSFCVLALSIVSIAQTKSPVDTSIVKVATKQISNQLNKTKDGYVSQLKAASDKFSPLLKLNKAPIIFSGSISTGGEYVSNSSLPSSYNGFYTRTVINGGVQIGSLPFNAGVSINFRNNRVWADYTAMHFNFDSKSFASGIKASYLDYLSDMNNFYPKELAEQVKGYNDSLNRMYDLQGVLSNKSYYDNLRQYNTDYNSLQDSVLTQTADSCTIEKYEQIGDSIAKYKNMAKEFENLQKFQSSNRDLQQYLNSYTGYVDSVKNMKNILSDEGIKNELRKSGILSKNEEAFGGIQKMGIGRVNLQLSEYTVRSQSILGLNVDYLFKGLVYTGIGLGVVSPNNFQFNPSFNNLNQMPKFNFSKFLGYLRLGLGKPEQDHVHLIYLAYGEKFTQNILSGNNYQSAPANSVLSLIYKKGIKQFFSLEGEIATSNSSFTDRRSTFSPIMIEKHKWKPNIAVSTTLKAQIKKTKTQASIKASAISSNYQSAGNLFQRRDYADYTLLFNQSLVSNKLNFTSMFNHGFSGIFSGINPASLLNFSSNLSTSAFSFATYTIQYTLVKQTLNQPESGLTNQQFSLLQQYSYGDKKLQCNTNITLSYTQTKYESGEFRQNSRMVQGNVGQQFIVKKGFGVNVSSGFSLTYAKSTLQKPAYWVETGNSINIKDKCKLNYNIKYLKDLSGFNNVFATLDMSATLYKGLSIKMSERLQVLWGLQQMVNSQTALSLNYTFSYTLKKNIQFKKGTKAITPNFLSKKIEIPY